MNDYEAKQEARRQRYLGRAEKATDESDRHYEESNRMGRMMQGEPIKVGHHSEGRHRRDYDRMYKHMDKSCEERNKAKYYEEKAASVGKGGISSDDPEAVLKLKAKLEKLEARQEMVKRVNRQYKKGGWDNVDGLSPETVQICKKAMSFVSWDPKPYPSYATTNNNANIRRIKERIATLARESEFTEREPIQGDGFTVSEYLNDNRIWFEFDQKPPKSICQIMRRNGWKWSPSRGAWVRNLNDAGRYSVTQTTEQIKSCLVEH